MVGDGGIEKQHQLELLTESRSAVARSIRCSSLPMLFHCARSLDKVAVPIDSENRALLLAALLGTAVHDALSLAVHDSAVDLGLVARRHGVDVEELRPLFAYGIKCWNELRASFPNPETEMVVRCERPEVVLTGHLDVLSISPEEGRLLDWKSGRQEEADYYPQLAGYAACVLASGVPRVTATVVWLRSQTVETYIFTNAEVADFFAALETRLGSEQPYSTGEHCSYCRRSHECQALVTTARRDIQIFGGFDPEQGIQSATPAQVVDLRRRLRVLSTFADSLEDAIRRRLMTDGPLDSGDGYTLELVEENARREVNALRAWPILQDALSDEEIAACVTVSASKVDDIVAKNAGKGQGAGAKRAMAARLEAAEAVTQRRIMKMKEIRKPREPKDGAK